MQALSNFHVAFILQHVGIAVNIILQFARAEKVTAKLHDKSVRSKTIDYPMAKLETLVSEVQNEMLRLQQ